MKAKIAAAFLCLGLFAESAYAVRSDLRALTGLKYPEGSLEGDEPVSASVLSPGPGFRYGGFSELVPFVLPAPDQEEAGSCLYMSLTGIAEWWMARLHPELPRGSEGPLDLSERHLMNVAGLEEADNGVENWKTDSIFLFHRMPGVLLNAEYPFAKGWHKTGSDGNYEKALPQEQGATYDAAYSWINELGEKKGARRLPRFQREVLFADPASNQWNTGVMPAGIVDRIKAALREKKAPVQVIYNHFGYWHANFIVGYDDTVDNGNCAFVTSFLGFMDRKEKSLIDQAQRATDPKEKTRLEALALKTGNAHRQARSAMEKNGCEAKGVFYVRDSIYGDPSAPLYDYDPSRKGEESPYSKPIVLLEYDWVRSMANHVTQIFLE